MKMKRSNASPSPQIDRPRKRNVLVPVETVDAAFLSIWYLMPPELRVSIRLFFFRASKWPNLRQRVPVRTRERVKRIMRKSGDWRVERAINAESKAERAEWIAGNRREGQSVHHTV